MMKMIVVTMIVTPSITAPVVWNDCISAAEEKGQAILPKQFTYKRYIMMTCEQFPKHCYRDKNNAESKS